MNNELKRIIMIELDNIYNMDCLEGMKMIPDGSVDAIICDLPYGVLNSESEGGSWDAVIPFGSLWEQYLRITKPASPIVLFAQGMFTADLMQSNRKMWRYNLVWNKTRATGHLNARKMPLRSHEDIVVFYRELPKYNPQFTKGEPNHSRGKMEKEQTNRCYGKANKPTDIFTVPKSIIDIPNKINGNWHPTQKPLDLLRYLVLTYTNPCDTVLDNTCGSGTTCLAAALEGRHYIGFELNKEYYDRAVKRIKEETRQLSLF